MKIVIDTNILISALLKDGLPESIILWILNNPEWEWLVSEAIMDEYKDVLGRKKFKFTDEFVNRWLDLLNESVTFHVPTLIIDFPRDRKDAKFLECAQSTKADIFITGNHDFEEAEALTDVFIISAANFARLFMQLQDRT